MKDISAQIHKGIYGCSDRANASENQSDEWQAGYAAGMADDRGLDIVFEEWKRRGRPEILTEGFREWKRGMWAATMQKVILKHLP